MLWSSEYPAEEAAALAIAALSSSHHPLTVAVNRSAWIKLTRHLGLQPKELVAKHASVLKEQFITGFEPTEVSLRRILKYIFFLLFRIPFRFF